MSIEICDLLNLVVPLWFESDLLSQKKSGYFPQNIFLLNVLAIIQLICDSSVTSLLLFLLHPAGSYYCERKLFLPSASQEGGLGTDGRKAKPIIHFSGSKVSSSFPSRVLSSTPFTEHSFPIMWQGTVVSRKSSARKVRRTRNVEVYT